MKNVLMIVPFFPPMAGGGVYRPLSFVKYLPRYGWNTTVVAQRGEAYWIHDPSLADQIPESCEVVRTSTLSGQSVLAALRAGSPQKQSRSSRGFGLIRALSSLVLMPDSYIGWYPYALRAAKRLLASKRFDAIYSTSPPESSHIIASRLARSTKLPWVADFRDPWMNLYLYPSPTRLHAAMHRRMEAAVFQRASVIVATRWQEASARARFPSADITLINNGYDGEEMSKVLDLSPGTEKFRILHAGMLTQKRTAVPFLTALRWFLDRRPEAAKRFEVTFLGPREDKNDEAVTRMGLQDVVRFEDSRPHSETLKIERRSHILLLIKHLDPAYTGLVPGKLYEYLGLRRPILALVPEGEAGDYVRQYGRGECVPLDDVDRISQAIERLYDAFGAGTLDDGYDLGAVDAFERSSLAGILAAALDRVTGV